MSSAELGDVAVSQGKGLITEQMYNMSGSSCLRKRKRYDGDEIVIKAMTKILFDQLSNAEEAPSERGLASKVVR